MLRIRAVLTRDDVASYAAALEAEPPRTAVDVIAMPVTRHVADPDQRDALVRAVEAGPYAFTIVASRHAAIFLARALATAHRAAGDLGEIWAVGPATRDALALERLPARVASGHDGEALARELIETRAISGQKILAPRAEAGRPEAIALLRASGADVIEVAAYRTQPIAAGDPEVAAGRDALTLTGDAICCVFAPSQVSALAAIVGPLPELRARFCAIGQTTAAALRAAGIETCGIASTPTPAGLAEAVRAMLATLAPA